MSVIIDANVRVNPSLDANARVNPILGEVKIQRYVDIAIPFICLYQPTAMATNVVLGVTKSVSILNNFNSSKDLVDLAMTVSTVALSILMPALNIAISQSYSILIQIDRLRKAVLNNNKKEALEATTNIALSSVYLASVFTSAPEVIAISIIAQGIFEFYQAMGEFKKGRSNFLEGMAKVIMGLFRLSQAKPIVEDLHRNYFGKKITQIELDKILEEIKQNQKQAAREQKNVITSDVTYLGPENFKEYLKKHNLSGHISDMNFEHFVFEKITFENMSFSNCNFSEVGMASSLVRNVKFDHCDMRAFTCIKTTFLHSSISNSQLFRSVFWNCEFDHFQFNTCDMKQGALNESTFRNFEIFRSNLLETSFFGLKVKNNVKLKECDLTDTLLCDAKEKMQFEGCTEHRITRPVVSLLWNFPMNRMFASIGREGISSTEEAIVLPIDYTPIDVNHLKLNDQVEACLNQIKAMPANSYESIPKELIKLGQKKFEILAIYKKAAEVIRHSSGLYLPGGEDVDPDYYGALPHEETDFSFDHRRGIYEFSLLTHALKKNIPVIGICRGVQIINVYHGGTLHQALGENHDGATHQISLNPAAPQKIQDIFNEMFGKEGIEGYSFHHQGCDKIGVGLEVAGTAEDGLPELLFSENGRIWGSQFHPEIWYWCAVTGVDLPGIKGKLLFDRFIRLMKERVASA